MDTKRLITGMAVAMLLVLGWQQLLQHLATTHPEWGWIPTTQAIVATTQDVEAPGATRPATTQSATVSIEPSTQPAGMWSVASVAPPTTQPSVIGSSTPKDPNVTMAVSIVPRGAGLSEVVLNDYRRTVDSQDRYAFEEPYGGATDDQSRALATRSITIDGQVVNLLTVDWKLTHSTVASASYRADVLRAGLPAVQIDKTYTLTPRSKDPTTPQGSEVTLEYKVTNLTGKPIAAKLIFNGPTCPPRENDRGDDRTIIGGYNHEGFAVLTHASISEITKDKPTREFTKDPDGKPMVWVGQSSVYFNAIVRPDLGRPIKIETATAIGLNNADPADQHVLLELETNTFTVAAGGSADSIDHVFFGPKKHELLNSAYYTAALVKYDETLVMKSSFFICGLLTFTPMINGLYYLLASFAWVLRDWGLAIICLVFLVRACLHPITKRAQLNMAKMSKMGPEIERLKKKHGDNKDELNKAMMQFYKTQGATPILGCLPMFLQMPIWLALYSALQSTFELRQQPFLSFFGYNLTWIKDLAHPDRLFYFPDHPLSFLFLHIDAINVLPILLGIVSWIQAKVTRSQQPPASTPEQAQQQKMMQWMTLMLPIILYNGPSGLNLYIMTSSIFGIIESKIVRKHIKEREELEKRGVVIVDNPPDDLPPTGSVRRKKGPPEPTPKKGGIMGWLADIQEKAQAMQNEQAKKNKKK